MRAERVCQVVTLVEDATYEMKNNRVASREVIVVAPHQNGGVFSHMRKLKLVKWELFGVLAVNLGVWLVLVKLAAVLSSKTLAW